MIPDEQDTPSTTRTDHRYSDTDVHPTSECSPERCGGDPRGWKNAVDPNKAGGRR